MAAPYLCLRVVRLDWGGGGVGGWVRGLWVGGLVWFWAIWPNVPTPPQGGGWGLGGWVGAVSFLFPPLPPQLLSKGMGGTLDFRFG